MELDRHWQRMIDGLREGDADVVAEFCDGYGPQLQRFARDHIAPGLRRRVGPETVVQSACFSFLQRAARGEYKLGDADDRGDCCVPSR